MKDEDVGLAMIMGIMLFLFTIVVATAAVVLRGWVLVYMWMWFIAEPFSVAAISIPHAIGLAGLLGLCTNRMNSTKKKKDEDSSGIRDLLVNLSDIFLVPLVTLLIGYVVHLFM